MQEARLTDTQLDVLRLIAEGHTLGDYVPRYKPGARRGRGAFPVTIATRAAVQLVRKGLVRLDPGSVSSYALTQAGADVLARYTSVRALALRGARVMQQHEVGANLTPSQERLLLHLRDRDLKLHPNQSLTRSTARPMRRLIELGLVKIIRERAARFPGLPGLVPGRNLDTYTLTDEGRALARRLRR